MTALKQYTIYDGQMLPHVRGSKGCFIGGTQISMADGSKKAIENIVVGDLVLAFDKESNLGPASVTETFKHEDDQFIKLIHWNGEITTTPNHWMLLEDGLFLEAGKLIAGEDQLVTEEGKISPIDEIVPAPSATSYNFTVSKQHTYIADNIRVHNKGGGGKGGGQGGGGAVEDPNDKFSTDILFTTIGFGEGPVYRVNANGPQDIEIQDGNIDDLINLDGDGRENTVLFKTLTNTGTVTQPALRVFGEEIATPQNFTSPVALKKGNVAGIPESKVELQDTSAQAWDALRFAFELRGLINQDDRGNIRGHTASLSIQVFNRTGTQSILPDGEPRIETISGKTNTLFRFDVTILIPEEFRSDDGYKFTIKKTSDDSDSSKIRDEISVKGWTEVEFKRQAYPRTAHIGYAIKAHSEHVGGIPNFTSMVKGLLVKVPSNYNQPVLESGEIDWRELEVIDGSGSTDNAYQKEGYSLQFSGPDTKLTADKPQLYVGTWDGTFVFNWTQNPVWIVYDILTNTTYGLGIPEDVIDKFKFYQVAQYCDACNVETGRFEGIIALSDGTFRHKPRGKFATIRENQFGLTIDTQIVERRFTCDITIADQGQVMDILNQITSIFRGALVYNMGKLTLAVDMPDELPVAMFNETNIKDGSFQISGIKESDIVTAVDVSYIEPTNHYKRETVRIDTVDRNDGRDKSALENLSTLDLIGVTRRSQALRYAQYHIAASRYLRRRVEFTTSIEAINISPGDVISVAQKMNGLGFGFGGRIRANSLVESSAVNKAQVFFEYFTEPTIPTTFFTQNTNPLAMRIYKTNSDRVDLYLIANNEFELITTQISKQATSNSSITSNANVNFGIDAANVKVTHMFNVVTKIFDALSAFPSNAAPAKGDIWMVGEMTNPGVPASSAADVYTNKAGKLFKVTGTNRTDEHEVEIEAIEYVSNVFVDSDEFIDYTPTAYTDILSPFTPPPAPDFQLRPSPRRTSDGSVVIDVLVDTFTDRTDYPLNISTDYFAAFPDVTQKVTNLTSTVGTIPPTFKLGNSAGLTDSLTPAILSGKNGFSGTLGEIRLLCNAVSETAAGGGDTTQFIEFTLEGLNVAFDFNFNKHILNVNDSAVFQGLKGIDQIGFPALEKANTGAPLGFVGHNPRTVQFASPILGFNANGTSTNASLTIAQNKLIVDNPTSTGSTTRLFSKIPSAPFYVTINQLLDTRFYANNNFYVSGTSYEYSRNNTVSLINPVGTATSAAKTSHVEPLEIVPRAKGFITAFVDGQEISDSSFLLHKGQFPANVEFLSLASDASTVRLVVDHYTVPTIEVGDNVQFTAGNVFPIIATSYDPAQTTSNQYTSNAVMTANNIYTITTGGESPKANVGGRTFLNISPDVTAAVGNVSGSSFTLDYDPFTFPGSFNLANNGVYDLSLGSDFNQIFLTEDRRIPDVRIGAISVKARNRNFQGRTSPFTVRTIIIEEIPIQKVTGLVITESLFIDKNQGVSVRATVAFNHITGQEVTDYEISYKITGQLQDLTTFNTVKVSATGVDDDGKIRFTINNLDRGDTATSNQLTVRVTPLNKEIRGITAEKTQDIAGKSAKPKNITNFSVGQSTDQVTLVWQFPDDIDLDLKEVVIRRRPGEVAATNANFIIAAPLVTVSAGVNRKSVPIDTFGEFTYLAKTRDTTGNESEDVISFTFTSVAPASEEPIFAFSEDSPSVNFTSLTNTNAGEANYPSFNTANAGGLTFANKGDGHPSSITDNSNGSSTGFSATSDADDLLMSGASGQYITAIRDMGVNDFYRVELDFEGSQSIKTTFNDLRTIITSDTSELQAGTPKANVIKAAGLGTLLGTTFSATYDSNNSSLIDKTSSGVTNSQNVFAIWNEGQFTGNAISISAITKASTARVTTSGSEHGIPTTSSPGTRIIVHDVAGMTDINNKELFAKRINATTVDLFTDSGLTSGLNSSGFGTYTSGGVLDQGDYSNSNSYALITGVINADHIELSNSFLANGNSTGGNLLANIASAAGNNFKLVDLRDYNDSTTFTFDGGGEDISRTIKMRISTQSNVYLGNGATGSNGNVNVVQFTASTIDNGFQVFEAGEKQFRFMQLKFDITNQDPDASDFTLDKIRYKISQQEKSFLQQTTYSSAPQTVDWSGKNFRQTPRVNLTVIDPGNAVFGVFTALSNVNGTVKLFKDDGTAKAADGSASINVSAIGV